MSGAVLILAKKGVAELLGTMFLTFSILSAISSSASSYVQVVFVHGFAIFNLGLIFGPISGGHFNPAVTLAFLLKRENRIPIVDLLVYFVCQLLGGILVGCINYGLWETPYYLNKTSNDWIGPLGNDEQDNSYVACFFAEALGTALLVLAVRMTESKRNFFVKEGSSFFGVLMIAGMLTYIGFMGILYYAGVNPARELGPRIAGAFFYGSRAFTSYTWIPIVGPFVGTFFGVAFYEMIERMYDVSNSQKFAEDL